jgi:hypothetical protein
MIHMLTSHNPKSLVAVPVPAGRLPYWRHALQLIS